MAQGAVGINTDPDCNGSTDPDMILSSSQGLNEQNKFLKAWGLGFGGFCPYYEALFHKHCQYAPCGEALTFLLCLEGLWNRCDLHKYFWELELRLFVSCLSFFKGTLCVN